MKKLNILFLFHFYTLNRMHTVFLLYKTLHSHLNADKFWFVCMQTCVSKVTVLSFMYFLQGEKYENKSLLPPRQWKQSIILRICKFLSFRVNSCKQNKSKSSIDNGNIHEKCLSKKKSPCNFFFLSSVYFMCLSILLMYAVKRNVVNQYKSIKCLHSLPSKNNNKKEEKP